MALAIWGCGTDLMAEDSEESRLIASAIAHGLPDARQATLVRGPLYLTPDDPARVGLSRDGLHAHLKDGTWLVDLWQPSGWTPGRVDASQARQLSRDTTTLLSPNDEDAIAALATTLLGEDAPDGWLDAIARVPGDVLHHPIAVVHLLRWERPEARPLLPVVDALLEARWQSPRPLVVETEKDNAEDAIPRARRLTTGEHTSVVIIRRILVDWFAEQGEMGTLPPTRVWAATEALIAGAPPDPMLARLVESMRAAAASSPTTPHDRLRGWGASTMLWSERDLPGLLDALDDQTISSWRTHGCLHSVGDNAMRAIAMLVGCDPRRLVAGDPERLWDEQERTAVVTTIRRVLAPTQHGTSLDAALATCSLPVDVAGLILEARSADRQAHLLAAWGANWLQQPPALEQVSAADFRRWLQMSSQAAWFPTLAKRLTIPVHLQNTWDAEGPSTQAP